MSSAPDKSRLLAERAIKRAASAKMRMELAERLRGEGNEFFKAGDFSGAAQRYQQAISTHGPRAVYCNNLAAALLKLEQYEEAEEASTQALRRDPKLLKARYRRGLARKAQEKLRGAMKDFCCVYKHDRSCAEARSEMDATMVLVVRGTGGRDTHSDLHDSEEELEYPPFDGPPCAAEAQALSGSSDCEHDGNGIPCKMYNRDGCPNGPRCEYQHSAHPESLRDDLGRNVCVRSLLGVCEFSDDDCGWTHDATYLRYDPEKVKVAREVYRALELDFEEPINRAVAARGLNNVQPARPTLTDEGKGSKKKRSEQGRSRRRAAKKAAKGGKGKAGMDNHGFTEDEVNELLCQGVKPWDPEARAVLDVLNGY